MKRKLPAVLFAIASALPAIALASDKLYTLSNDATSNAVYAYQHSPKGGFSLIGNYATGGAGTGAGLGNQGALAISANEHYLFAVNAGSNEVSVFAIQKNGLTLLDTVPDNGKTPVSITVHDNLVYVVNSGDDSIFGYQFDSVTGKLTALTDSYQPLGGTGTGAAQISFNSTGTVLVVSEKATNKLTSFHLNHRGVPNGSYSIDSAGSTPFGFAFGKRDQVFVSEAQGGGSNLNASSVSSYASADNGKLTLIDGEVKSFQTAACWLVTTPDGRMAFTADTPANALSSYKIDFDGHLKLAQSQAAVANKPGDLAISGDGSTLYSLNGGDHTLASYQIKADGQLISGDTLPSLPLFATGLIVR
ncbi:MAG: beta-propeller fold lactonase family protein [Methylovulum sp.]|nr:beta-propeller fold lactonase family protein [Methylovulum sp.]